MKLNKEAFAKARRFILREARPIDQALFSFYFEDGPREAVIAALTAYQNEDGGFGHCLEPDFRLYASSVMATTVAFQYLQAVGATSAHPMVPKGVRFVLDELNQEAMAWEAVPPGIDAVARAPWWTHGIWAERGEDEWANPNAECLAILMQYKERVPVPLLDALTHKAQRALRRAKRPAEMHDFLCWQRLSRAAGDPLRSEIHAYLSEQAPALIGKDAKAWENYGLRPYWVIETKLDSLYPAYRTALEANLDYEISHQGEDGSWAPNWTWGQFEETWKVARREWAGHLTVKLLHRLQTFGRLE